MNKTRRWKAKRRRRITKLLDQFTTPWKYSNVDDFDDSVTFCMAWYCQRSYAGAQLTKAGVTPPDGAWW